MKLRHPISFLFLAGQLHVGYMPVGLPLLFLSTLSYSESPGPTGAEVSCSKTPFWPMHGKQPVPKVYNVPPLPFMQSTKFSAVSKGEDIVVAGGATVVVVGLGLQQHPHLYPSPALHQGWLHIPP